MKSVLTNPVYLAAITLGALNQVAERNGVFIPFIHSYLDDFLCFPIVLSTGLLSYRLAYPNYVLSGWHIWPLFAIIVIYFEIYLPRISTVYTADVWDVFAYLAGIRVFQKTVNRPKMQLTSLKSA